MRLPSIRVLVTVLACLLLAAWATRLGTHPPTAAPAPTATTSSPSSASPSSASPSPSASTAGMVVGLGDSVTAGTACACLPFVQRYAVGLGRRDGVTVHAANLGQPGLTTAGLRSQLTGDRTTRADLARAGTVLVTIGANDLVPLTGSWEDGGCDTSCATPAVEAMERGLDGDLALLQTLTPAHTTVLVTSYWNVFEDGDVADATRGPGFAGWSDGVTKLANTAICRAAAAASDTCVDLYEPFEGSDGTQNPTKLLAADGDHPDAAGHDLIARALLAATPS